MFTRQIANIRVHTYIEIYKYECTKASESVQTHSFQLYNRIGRSFIVDNSKKYVIINLNNSIDSFKLVL